VRRGAKKRKSLAILEGNKKAKSLLITVIARATRKPRILEE